MAQPNSPSGNEADGRDQTGCMKDAVQFQVSSSNTLKGKEIQSEEGCSRGQPQYCKCSTNLWLSQAKKKVDSRDKDWQVSEEMCICRVPKPIMVSNPQAYVPLVVSFGFYHQTATSELSRMDEHKLQAVYRISTRCGVDSHQLIAKVGMLECKVRECYEEPIDLDGETLSWMLTMDACFILEILRGNRDFNDPYSLIFPHWEASQNSTIIAIIDDIMKLENQIPLFVLVEILQLEYKTPKQAREELAASICMQNIFNGYPFEFSFVEADIVAKSRLEGHMEKERGPYHLLDLYRMVIVDLLKRSTPSTGFQIPYYSSTGTSFQGSYHHIGRTCNNILHRLSRKHFVHDMSIPNAVLLHKAGIRLQPGKLRFEKKWFQTSTLLLHQFTVDDRTERLLRNLMAYEECRICLHPEESNVISQYVRILDELIDSEKDVSLLRKSLIITSFLGSDEEIARMVNRLSDGITFSKVKIFDKVMEEARDHYRSQLKVWISEFKQQHCSKPWYVVSLVAAILILGMTAVQTVYSVKK